MKISMKIITAVCGIFIWCMPSAILAHCDTMDGPVIAAAKTALEKADVTPVLKWVSSEHEAEIRDVFAKAIAVRQKSPEAQELADRYFFETLVRVHRAGEGAPYTGLKPAGQVEPVIAEADRALQTGSPDDLVRLITHAIEEGIRRRFQHTEETMKRADANTAAGREFVEAYVEFTHYVERLHIDAAGAELHHQAEDAAETPAGELQLHDH